MIGIVLAATITLSSPFGTAEVATYGAVMKSWKPKDSSEVFAMAKPYESCDPESQIHGGFPLCWPWAVFEGEKGCKIHGITRYNEWKVAERSPHSVTLVLEDCESTRKVWPYAFRAELTYELDRELSVAFKVVNRDTRPFTCTELFHPYFRVGDTVKCVVTGTDGVPYFWEPEADKGGKRKWSGDFSGLLVKDGKAGYVFEEGPHTHLLKDPALGRTIKVTYSGNPKFVIWGSANDFTQYGGADDPDFGRKFICVEGGNIYRDCAYTLQPGETHVLTAKVAVERGATIPAKRLVPADGAGARCCKGVRFEPLPMRYGDPVRTWNGMPFAKDPTVIRHGGRYLVYYSSCDYPDATRPKGWPKGAWHISIAESRDLINWNRLGDLKIENCHHQVSAVDPCVIKKDGVLHIFYQARTDKMKWNAIWHATGEDGVTFRGEEKPVIVPNNSWSVPRAIGVKTYRAGNRLMAIYSTRERPTAKIQYMGMSWAPYDSDYGVGCWTEITTDGPFLKPELTWESRCIEGCSVVEHKGIWYLFYGGGYNNEYQQIGMAWSADGVHFSRYSDQPVFSHGGPGEWNAAESGHPGTFVDDDGQIYIFYQGKSRMSYKGKDTGTVGNYLLSCMKVHFED